MITGACSYETYAGQKTIDRQFPIATEVRFLWRDTDDALHMGVGISHHISRSDIQIRAQHSPSLGTRVQVIVDMPPARPNNARRARLTGHGIVVRVEHNGRQAVTFAVKVCFQQRWAYRSAPLGNEAPWREDTMMLPIPQQERLVGAQYEGHFF